MYLLGIDLGTSSVKASVIDAGTRELIASASFPETEAEILTPHPGWAEQAPGQWWEFIQKAIRKCHATGLYEPEKIAAIGIAYQMHGLVLVDKDQNVIRHSIIWCDSRAVETGNRAFEAIGEEKCLSHLLNSPGNFTASKLAWVKENEPFIYERVYKAMLPGDFVAMKFTGEITTTVSALSEGVFWDFQNNGLSEDVMKCYGFSPDLLPEVHPLFSTHGGVTEEVATSLALKPGIPVSYKAGDQPNNALSLNVLRPGEVAATAGTSGVIYGVSGALTFDRASRINSFAHVNYTDEEKRIGVLLCINGTGIFNRWIRNIAGAHMNYRELNQLAGRVAPGSERLFAIPFGNGAERMLNNKIVGAHFQNIDLNLHRTPHLIRAVQEGIVFSFRYGLDIMRENGMSPSIVRAPKANLFQSEVFSQAFADTNDVILEFYEGDGSLGAAIGAGIGAGFFSAEEAGSTRKPVDTLQPGKNASVYEDLYAKWKDELQKLL